MTKDTAQTFATELSDDDLDAVQGAGTKRVTARAQKPRMTKGKLGVILSSESEEPTLKQERKGMIVLDQDLETE